MNKRKNIRVLAIGLFIISTNTLIRRFIFPANDFVCGWFYGIGLGMLLLALYRMKFKSNI